MLCTLSADITLDNSLELLKGLLIQVTQRLDLHYLLKLCQCSLTLAAALIVLGISQASLFITACDHDLRIFQMDRCVLIFQSCGVQKNSIILFAHGNGKLVHDTAVYLVVFVLGELSDQCKILIGHIKSEEISQNIAGQHFYRSGRGKSGTVGNITVQQQIHTGSHFHALLTESPDHSLGIIGPACFLAGYQILQRRFDHSQMSEIHGIETQLIVVSLSCHTIGTDGQCAGENVSAVIVGMFTDQIHTSRCKISLSALCISKYFCESFQNRLFHFHFSTPVCLRCKPLTFMFSFVTLRRNARLRILLLYVFIIIKKNGFFYLFMFSKPVIMLKATSHANPKRKTRPGSLLTRTCFSFWIYTATAVHEVDAVRLRMCMAQFHGVLYSALCFRYCTGVMSYAFLNRRLKCSTFS